ncbi:hypothetical protein RHMOL_Rhmol02G0156500 [Rhododendron molle]|uniref:Uncharacterized protein n=1 Tax=Rhododendron molle TaxID=49168 RepID=A0ACC0PQC0_RHOML|nr:hypothetical protein RHMOL_Rhmol02G0156500 [Rhododendron molle]
MRRCRNQLILKAAILFFPAREKYALAILEYKATYQGFIKEKKASTVVAEENTEPQQEKAEVVLEDSFGEIPEVLLPSLQHPLRGTLRVPREETTDEEGEEVEMAPRDIMADLERRKKKRLEEEKAKAAAKSGPSAGDPAAKTSRVIGSQVPPPPSSATKRPHPPVAQLKDDTIEKKQKTVDTGSAVQSEMEKGKGALARLPRLWAPQTVARTLPESAMSERHEQWMARYGRVYKDDAEREMRYEIFKDNVEFIESFNRAGNRLYKLGINHFADITKKEFQASHNGYKKPPQLRQSEGTKFRYENVSAVPASMDWRKKGAVTPIKDQGQCGAFFAYLNIPL